MSYNKQLEHYTHSRMVPTKGTPIDGITASVNEVDPSDSITVPDGQWPPGAILRNIVR